MRHVRRRVVIAASALAWPTVVQAAGPLVVVTTASAAAAVTDRATCAAVTADGTTWLEIRPTPGTDGSATLSPPSGEWDLSAAEGVSVRLRNVGPAAVTVRLVAANPTAAGLADGCRYAVELAAGVDRTVLFRLTRRPVDPTYQPFEPFYMYFKGLTVRDNTVDPAHIARLTLSATGPVRAAGFDPAGTGTAAPVPFFPFVDAYGQYVHGDWPGKIHAPADFAARVADERAEEAGHPGPPDRDPYGGWAAGPTLKATGHFYPAKHDGRWWLVDPAGRLFWSYGVTGVGFGGDLTPVTGRADWFDDLPAKDGPLAAFYKPGRGAAYRFYKDRDWVGFDFQRANLVRKYGPDYERAVAGQAQVRLRSWGFDTIGNWSAAGVYELRKTPYTVAIQYGSAMINAHLPDVFDAGWEPAVRGRMIQERAATAGDPWNLGYFVDNERWFGSRGRAATVGEETLKCPPDRAAKVRFVDRLKDKYRSVGKLNAAWKTTHVTWDAVLAAREPPDPKVPAVLADCGDFGMAYADRYFAVCRAAVKAVAPDNLYLGSRFFGHTDPELVRLAAKYCDVISYNIYDNPPDGRVNQYAKLDAPILAGEWGVGSDPLQTPFRGATAAADPAERATLLTRYVDHALRLPNLVGCHFFQFRDQPISGRPDGEATLRGFVNVADTPNFELVRASRAVADRLYPTRAGRR